MLHSSDLARSLAPLMPQPLYRVRGGNDSHLTLTLTRTLPLTLTPTLGPTRMRCVMVARTVHRVSVTLTLTLTATLGPTRTVHRVSVTRSLARGTQGSPSCTAEGGSGHDPSRGQGTCRPCGAHSTQRESDTHTHTHACTKTERGRRSESHGYSDRGTGARHGGGTRLPSSVNRLGLGLG